MRGAVYTLADDKKMLTLVAQGLARGAIAEKLDRTLDSINGRLAFLRREGIYVPKFRRCTHLSDLKKFAAKLAPSNHSAPAK